MRIEQGLAQLADPRLQNGQPPRDGWDLESVAELRQAVDTLREFVRRFVVVSDDALITIALWIMHTHAIDAFDATPYLQITSPQKQCGKSRLLEVLELLVARPWLTSKTSAAALVRKVAKDAPTLLLDETDAAFGGEKEYAEALRGIVNAGHRRGGVASLCVGKEHKVEDFPVFCAKALAGIGTLPDTIADRSIRIDLQRRLPGEPIHRLRRRLIGDEAEELRGTVARLAKTGIEELRKATPPLPDELSDRAQDAWEPLLAIADIAGLGEKARGAAVNLSARSMADEEDIGLRCLRDVRTVFELRAPTDRFTSADMVTELRAIEEGPYGSLHGRDFDPRALARRLRPFKIRPGSIDAPGDKRARGYLRAWFEPVWDRYLAPITHVAEANTDAKCDPSESSSSNPSEVRDLRDDPYAVRVLPVIAGSRVTDAKCDPSESDHGDHADHTYSRDIERL